MVVKNKYSTFWEALIITLFIFGLGILLGIFIEQNRAEKISDMYEKAKINLLDVQVTTNFLDLMDINCDKANEENIIFGNKIYEDAKILERYESAGRMTDSLIEQHKKYDLLRNLFWINSIKIREKCGHRVHTVVYLYNYDEQDLIERSKQNVFSRFLLDLKWDYGNDILLIPIAKNMNLSSIDLMTYKYNVSKTSIIINEKLVVDELEDLSKINDFIEQHKLESEIIQLN